MSFLVRHSFCLWIFFFFQSVFSQPLNEAQLDRIARGLSEPWIGWQELCAAALPINQAETAAIIAKIENAPGAWSAMAAFHEKNQKPDQAIQVLEREQIGEECTNKNLWLSRLLFEKGDIFAASLALNKADLHLHQTRSPYERLPVFVSHTRMAFSLGKLDVQRRWLEWILEEKCSALMQWNAFKELRDLDYHEQKSNNATLPNWLKCMITAEGNSYAAQEFLAQGKNTWWKDLTWDQRCLLCETIYNRQDLASSLIPYLNSENQEQRRRILTSLQAIHSDQSVLMRHFFRNRELYKKLLPDLIHLQVHQLVTSRALAHLAQEESSKHSQDVERKLFAQLQGDPYGKIDPTQDMTIWKSIKAEDIKLPDLFNQKSLNALNDSTRLLVSFCYAQTKAACESLVAAHPQAPLMPRNIHDKMSELRDYFARRKFPQATPPDEARRELEDTWRALQMFTSPDIGRLRYIHTPFYHGIHNHQQWYFYRYDNRDHSLLFMASPLQNNEICDSRQLIANASVKEWSTTLTGRVAKHSPLDNQIFLLQQVGYASNRQEKGISRESFKPSNLYPSATRSLMELQCNELYPDPAKLARPLLEKVLQDLPIIGLYLQQCSDKFRGFSRVTHLLQEHEDKFYSQNRSEELLNHEKILEQQVYRFLASDTFGMENIFAKSNNPDQTIAQIKKVLNDLGRDTQFQNRDIMALVPERFKSAYAPAVLKQWPSDSTAFTIMLRDAVARSDGKLIFQLIEDAISQPFYLYSGDSMELLNEAQLQQLLSSIRTHQGKANTKLHLDFAKQMLTLIHLRYPQKTEDGIESIFVWFPPEEHRSLEEQLKKLYREGKVPVAQLGKFQHWFTQNSATPVDVILEPENKQNAITPEIEANWGIARAMGQGKEVTKAFEQWTAALKIPEVNYHSISQMQHACRFASDQKWSEFLKSYRAYDSPLPMIRYHAIHAARCYFDGRESRAEEWLNAMSDLLKVAKVYTEENSRYSSHTIAAEAIATAWIWLGRTDKADQLTEWLKPLSDQPKWNAYLRRNNPLADEIAVETCLSRSLDGNLRVHWIISNAQENFSGAFGMWDMPPLSNDWKLFYSIKELNPLASPSQLHEIPHNGQCHGSISISRNDRSFDGTVRVLRNNLEWSESYLYGSGEVKNTKFIKSIALAPVLQQKLKQSTLKLTNSDAMSWVTGSQTISGWVPKGGLEILTFDAAPGDIVNLAGFITTLSRGSLVLTNADENARSRFTDTMSSFGTSIDWFTGKPQKDLARVSSAKQRLRLDGANDDGSGFVVMRLIDPTLEFHQPVAPDELETIAVFPDDVNRIAIHEKNQLALATNGELIQSCRLNGKNWPSDHKIGNSQVRHLGFAGQFACALDHDGGFWIAALEELVFRSAGKIDPLPEYVAWDSKHSQFVTWDAVNAWRAWQIDEQKIKLLGSFTLGNSYHFRFSDEIGTMIIRNLRDNDVYELLDVRNGKTTKQNIPQETSGMQAYYRDGYTNWIWKERSHDPLAPTRSNDTFKNVQKIISDWDNSGKHYSADGKFLFLMQEGVVRRLALPIFK